MSDIPLDKRELAECFHPSVFINEELTERGWTLNDLTFRMRQFESEKDWAIERLAVEMYLTVQSPHILLADDMAEGFAKAFGVSAEMFRNMHKMWREHAQRAADPSGQQEER